MSLKEKTLYEYYVSHPELEDVYLRNDPDFQTRERELREAVAGIEPLIRDLGEDAWNRLDRVLTAHNRCEERAMQVMYVKGGLDMFAPLFLYIRIRGRSLPGHLQAHRRAWPGRGDPALAGQKSGLPDQRSA